jgi:DNA-binding transcriptional MerR regulator/methylmalonyl-CoA mutase cobalamin-binding subunit
MRLAAERTGLTPDVLRVWERRYGAVRPRRSRGNRRLYSAAELDRLRLLARATRQGRPISLLAPLDDARLRAVVEADESAAMRSGGAGERYPAPEHAVDEALAAVRALSAAALDRALARAALSFPRAILLEDVFAALLRRIGDLWQSGNLRVAHEHLASALVRGVLAQLGGGSEGGAGPLLVSATPAGQRHEFGALMAALEAEGAGYRVAYLGPDLPAEEIASAAAALGASVVALSIVHPADDPRLGAELERLRRLVGREVALLAGGAAASGYARALDRAGVDALPSLRALRERLRDLRAGRC